MSSSSFNCRRVFFTCMHTALEYVCDAALVHTCVCVFVCAENASIHLRLEQIHCVRVLCSLDFTCYFFSFFFFFLLPFRPIQSVHRTQAGEQESGHTVSACEKVFIPVLFSTLYSLIIKGINTTKGTSANEMEMNKKDRNTEKAIRNTHKIMENKNELKRNKNQW